MKIKKYFAADLRQALKLARQEHGPDVVILGNRRVMGGVELIAADDYDEVLQSMDQQRKKAGRELPLNEAEARPRVDTQPPKASAPTTKPYIPLKQQKEGVVWSDGRSLDMVKEEINALRTLLEQQMSGLAWGDIGRRHPLWAGLLRKLGGLGIGPEIAKEVVEQVPEQYGFDKAWRTCLALLSYRIPIYPDNILTRGAVIAFIGATGAGKTTTIAKLATRFVLEHGPANIILATLDSHRVGGREQLGSYAKILGIPLRTLYDSDDLSELLEHYHGRKLVLIDTAGLSPNDIHHQGQITLLQSTNRNLSICPVLSATSQVSTLKQVIHAYHSLRPEVCVLTKLDEASSLGGILSLVIGERLKIAYQCAGQRVPEDIQPAVAVDLITCAISTVNRNRSECDPAQIEQDFGHYAVYNPIGAQRGH